MHFFPLLAVETVPASRVLAAVFAAFFVAIVFAGAWRGYWRGPLRQIAPLAAFTVAGTLAWFFGAPLGEALLGHLGVPWILRGILGMLLLGILIWLPVFSILWARGRKQVSEESGEPHSPILGAVVGCWTGGFFVVTFVFLIAAAGTLGDAFLTGRKNSTQSILGKCAYCGSIAKKSVALIPGFKFAAKISPIPDKTLRIINKLVDVCSKPAIRSRLFDIPEVNYISSLPAVYPLFNAPEIQEMFQKRDIEGLLSDPRVMAMFDDEDFQRAFAEFDFEKALDQALAGTLEDNK